MGPRLSACAASLHFIMFYHSLSRGTERRGAKVTSGHPPQVPVPLMNKLPLILLHVYFFTRDRIYLQSKWL